MRPGERLRKWRNEQNLSSTEVAKNIGMSQSMLTTYENGKSGLSDKYLINLQKVYGISIDWLLTGNAPSEITTSIPEQYKEIFQIYDLLPSNRQQDLINIGKTFLQPAENQAIEESSSVSRKAG